MAKERKKPEWTPKDSGPEFASNVMKGIEDSSPESSGKRETVSRQKLNIDEYVKGIVSGDRVTLGRAITLIESNSSQHLKDAQHVLSGIMPRTGNSIRIGITGIPGGGKSTFIETFGLYLIEHGHRVAVLAVDPSSSVSGGSILGDKTRMEKLAVRKESFIRPSPAGGTLGGVTRKTRESILLCEAAGFDVVLVETVGVGQNEITVRSMVDFFLLIQIAGGGDELQGIKKGVMEIADAVIVNKADGDNIKNALAAKNEYEMALHYTQNATPGWEARAFTCSALTGEGIEEIWQTVSKFRELMNSSGYFEKRRQLQIKDWLHSLIEEYLSNQFYDDPHIQKQLPDIEKETMNGSKTVVDAVDYLFNLIK